MVRSADPAADSQLPHTSFIVSQQTGPTIKAPAAESPSASTSELEAKVKALEAKLARLKADTQSRPSAADTDAVVRRLLDDADRRSRPSRCSARSSSSGWPC